METLRRKIFLLALALIAVLIFAQCAKRSQNGGVTTVTNVTATRNSPAWQGKAAGVVQPFKLKKRSLKAALLAHPVPEVWLVFAENSNKGQPPSTASESKEAFITVQLPPEAKSILNSFWKVALEYEYYRVFEKKKHSVQDNTDRFLAWAYYHEGMIGKLRQVEIDAPGGRRTISDDEARELLPFTHKAAIDLMEREKAYQKEQANTF
ncbi:MAG: hypothetical protein WBP93_04410 [Pyrinomonadaceae bacterium]